MEDESKKVTNNKNMTVMMRTSEEEDDDDKDDQRGMLPGFRFHPTDEELVGFYLTSKVQKKTLRIELIKNIDIYKYDPWDLPSNYYPSLSNFLLLKFILTLSHM